MVCAEVQRRLWHPPLNEQPARRQASKCEHPVSRPSEARGSRDQVKLSVDLVGGPEDSTRLGVKTVR